ncbi:MAG: DUF1573 domain-containing protein [Bacteroidia bacterium]|nr:DUF1573 domain-containing protein [Bacteroidia bacterium]MDW8159342.1 DUF1573 domain-containing protein [Bacteroidia bacterium]
MLNKKVYTFISVLPKLSNSMQVYYFLILFALCVGINYNFAWAQKKQRARDKKAKIEQPTTTPVTLMAPEPPLINSKPTEKELEKSPVSNKPKGPYLVLESDSYNFGKVKQGEVIKHSFRIKNQGSADLLLTSVKPSCGCTISEWPKNAIKPGETAQIDVKFNTAGKLGKQKKSITISTNMEPNNLVVLYLEGEVINPLLPSP